VLTVDRHAPMFHEAPGEEADWPIGRISNAQIRVGQCSVAGMYVHVSLAGPGNLSDRIYRQLLDAILDRRLRPDAQLPPTRELARQLAVSRNTVAVAYDRLTAEGFLVARVGAGTFVCAEPPGRRGLRSAPAGRAVSPSTRWDALREPPDEPMPSVRYQFGVGLPDPALFPLDLWRRLIARELRALAPDAADYADPAGHPALRVAIARHVGIARSVSAAADDVLITNGAQQALDLLGRILLDPGDCVAVEEPGYRPARRLFASYGARVVGVPVDDEGLDVAAIPREARLVYTTPSHQFPLGVSMSLRRRAALLDWAERRGAVVIEDDYDSEFRFADRPLAPLQSLDNGGRVVYVGSFSKTLLPTLRLGFLVAPASLRPALSTARQLSDWHGGLLTQAALARFLDDGLFARHVRKAAREYAARHALVRAVVEEDLPYLQLIPSVAGLHVCARLASCADVDLDQVVSRARADGVAIRALSRFASESVDQRGLVIGYGAIKRERIVHGLHRLAAAFDHARLAH